MTGAYEDRVMPLLAAGAVVLAWTTDPGTPFEDALLALAAAVVAAAVLTKLTPLVSTPLLIVAVGVATVHGHLEPGLFLLSLMALQLTATLPLSIPLGVLVAALLATPWTVRALNPGDDLSAAIWTLGIVFPAAMGWGLQRQARLTAELARAHYELADRAVDEERQRIAREVHDLVGHGLSAALLQVASARHVLRRDPESADEALAHAERIGRASMAELRSTLAVMRDRTTDDGRSLPRLGDLGRAVDDARAHGLDVSLRTLGETDVVDPVVGLTLVRIGQEALANAVRHAPHAPTRVTLDTSGELVSLEVTSEGATAAAANPEGYGVLGMQERAQLVGGELSAGPVDAGWRVACVVPRRVPA